MLANLEGLWTLSSWVLLRLHFTVRTAYIIGHRQLIQPPGPLLSRRSGGEGWNFQPSNHKASSTGNQPSSLTAFPKVTSLIQQNIPLSLSTFRKFQRLWELWDRNSGRRSNISEKYILVTRMIKHIVHINHNITRLISKIHIFKPN